MGELYQIAALIRHIYSYNGVKSYEDCLSKEDDLRDEFLEDNNDKKKGDMYLYNSEAKNFYASLQDVCGYGDVFVLIYKIGHDRYSIEIDKFEDLAAIGHRNNAEFSAFFLINTNKAFRDLRTAI